MTYHLDVPRNFLRDVLHDVGHGVPRGNRLRVPRGVPRGGALRGVHDGVRLL